MVQKRKISQPTTTHLGIKIFLVVVLIFVALCGYMIFYPRSIPNDSYKLIVAKGDSFSKVAKRLDEANVIPNRQLFVIVARLLGKDRKITAGMYLLNKPLSMYDLIDRLTNGRPDQISFTILEGWNFKQLRRSIDNESQINHLTSAMTESQILSTLKINRTRIDGLFYPSTYFVAPGQSDLEVYQMAYRTMQQKLANIWQTRNESDTVYKDPYELLTMASLIQKETSESQDMILVSTVFNNRLRINMRLQDDPAVFYGLDNKDVITRADFAIDTPYNTYLHNGLPPTPICIPSQNALNAAANPTSDHSLLYFVAIGNGRTKFSTSYDEHSQAVNKYLKKDKKDKKDKKVKS